MPNRILSYSKRVKGKSRGNLPHLFFHLLIKKSLLEKQVLTTGSYPAFYQPFSLSQTTAIQYENPLHNKKNEIRKFSILENLSTYNILQIPYYKHFSE